MSSAFLMKHQGLSFTDAVKFVGSAMRRGRAGRPEGPGAADDPLRPYYEASAFAKAFYAECLWDEDVGRRGPEAIWKGGGSHGRRPSDTASGFAPDEWRAFQGPRGSSTAWMNASCSELGLLKKSEKRDEPYDALRNRIVFPIETVGGKVVAFGGRLLGQSRKGAPKYLNSPEEPGLPQERDPLRSQLGQEPHPPRGACPGGGRLHGRGISRIRGPGGRRRTARYRP